MIEFVDKRRSTFDLKAPAWTSSNALAMGIASQVAYSMPATLLKTVSAWAGVAPAFIGRGDTQLFAAYCGEFILVAFRGTEPTQLSDWRTDTSAALVDDPLAPGKVHEGFRDALGFVWQDLSEVLAGVQEKAERDLGTRLPVCLTGHSLGGALAELCAARFAAGRLQDVRCVYTYGKPMVGNDDYARTVEAAIGRRAFRVVNNNDIVPWNPPEALGYHHVGRLCYLTSSGRLRFDPPLSELVVDGLAGALKDLGTAGPDGVKDHYLEAYLTVLAALCV